MCGKHDTNDTISDTNVTSKCDNCGTNVTSFCDNREANVTKMCDKHDTNDTISDTNVTTMRDINSSHQKTAQKAKKRPKRSVTTSKSEKRKSLKKMDENAVGVKCGICDKVLASQNLLVIHVKQCHNGKRDIKCNKCDWTTE